MNEKLVKLVVMLSSSNDNEVLNAVRMIGGHLKSMNKDWHDLGVHVASFGEKPQASQGTGVPTRERPQSKPRNSPNARWSGVDISVLKDMIYELSGKVGKVRMMENEVNFINDLAYRVEIYADDISISPKQGEWVETLYKKYVSGRRV